MLWVIMADGASCCHLWSSQVGLNNQHEKKVDGGRLICRIFHNWDQTTSAEGLLHGWVMFVSHCLLA